MAFSFLNIFSRSKDIKVFVQKLMTSQIVSFQINFPGLWVFIV